MIPYFSLEKNEILHILGKHITDRRTSTSVRRHHCPCRESKESFKCKKAEDKEIAFLKMLQMFYNIDVTFR